MILCTLERGGKISRQSLSRRNDRKGKIFNQSRRNDRNKICKRKVLPPELSRHMTMLTCESAADGGVCDVYVVGTSHISAKSAQRVKAVIEFLKPQVVFLELCSFRRNGILPPQKEKIGAVEVQNGAEFHLAYKEAMKYGAKVILGDRPIGITWRRTWVKIPLWDKLKYMCSFVYWLLFEEESSCRDLIKMVKKIEEGGENLSDEEISDIKKIFRCLEETMVNERDQYMSAKLLRVARKHNSVVAVVGRGHLPGIKMNWKQPVDVEQLLSAPSHVMMFIYYGVFAGVVWCSLYCLFAVI